MKMKLIDKTYDIKFISNEKIQTDKDKKEKFCTYGAHYATKCLINVNDSLNDLMQRSTLVHEIVHALDSMCYVKTLTELQTEAIGKELLYFIKNNPKIIEWICKVK